MKIFLKSAVGIVLFAILLSFVDWRRSVAILLDTAPLPALLALLVLSTNMLISTLKWQILLLAQGISVPWHWLLKCYWISSFFSNYFPSNVGGDVVRLMMMHHLGSSAQVAASIFLERWTGFVVLLGLSALSLLMRPQYFMTGNLLLVLWLTVFILSIFIILPLIIGKHINKLFPRLFGRKEGFFSNISKKLDKFFSAINYFRGKRREIVINLILSLLFYSVIIFFQYLIFVSVGRSLPLQEVFFIAPLIPFLSLLPISLNGLGLAEGAFVIFYTQAGVSPEIALAASVLRRVLSVLVSLVGGVLWLMNQSKLQLSASNFTVFVRKLRGIR